MPVFVRNNQAGPTVFTEPDKKVEYKWAGKNDPEGEDLQQVPDDVAENVFFLRAVAKGILTITKADDPAIAKAIASQTSTWGQEQEAEAMAVLEAMDRSEEEALVTMKPEDFEEKRTEDIAADVDRQMRESRN